MAVITYEWRGWGDEVTDDPMGSFYAAVYSDGNLLPRVGRVTAFHVGWSTGDPVWRMDGTAADWSRQDKRTDGFYDADGDPVANPNLWDHVVIDWVIDTGHVRVEMDVVTPTELDGWR